MVVEVPIWPPTAKPCSSLATITTAGPSRPAWAWVGAMVNSSEPIAISHRVRRMAALRPTRSAYRPITRPPSGRMTKPVPNTARESSRGISGWSPKGKNSLAISVASML
ncbi:hypothetical protein D3C78_1104650 [compost metagenome]